MSDKKILTNDKPISTPTKQNAVGNKQIPNKKKDGIIERKNSRVMTDDGKELLKES